MTRKRSLLAATLLGAAAWQGVAGAPARAPQVVAAGPVALVDTTALARHAVRATTPKGRLVAAVRPGSSVELLSAPGGASIGTLGDVTEFGSASRFHVARARGRWLGLATPLRPNGELAWVDRESDGLRLLRTTSALSVDLSEGRLELRRAGRLVQSASIGSGRPGSPTPTGLFSVTDKIAGSSYSGAAYGCCIIALSGHQPNTPPGWRGGNRLAVHGGGASETASTAGCVRTSEANLQALMARVPLGAPVLIRQ